MFLLLRPLSYLLIIFLFFPNNYNGVVFHHKRWVFNQDPIPSLKDTKALGERGVLKT